MEVDVLSNRLRNIKQSYKTTENKALKGRLISENKNIFKRVKEIYKIADLLNKKNNEELNFSKLRSSELLIAPIGTQTVSVAPSFIETSPL
jgi:hypothetical protein